MLRLNIWPNLHLRLFTLFIVVFLPPNFDVAGLKARFIFVYCCLRKRKIGQFCTIKPSAGGFIVRFCPIKIIDIMTGCRIRCHLSKPFIGLRLQPPHSFYHNFWQTIYKNLSTIQVFDNWVGAEQVVSVFRKSENQYNSGSSISLKSIGTYPYKKSCSCAR